MALYPSAQNFLRNIFDIKKFDDKTFCACVAFLNHGRIYGPEFMHKNNDNPVSHVLDM